MTMMRFLLPLLMVIMIISDRSQKRGWSNSLIAGPPNRTPCHCLPVLSGILSTSMYTPIFIITNDHSSSRLRSKLILLSSARTVNFRFKTKLKQSRHPSEIYFHHNQLTVLSNGVIYISGSPAHSRCCITIPQATLPGSLEKFPNFVKMVATFHDNSPLLLKTQKPANSNDLMMSYF